MPEHRNDDFAENRPDDPTNAGSRSENEQKYWSNLLYPHSNDTLPLPLETTYRAPAADAAYEPGDVLRGGAGNDTLLDKKASDATSLPDGEAKVLTAATPTEFEDAQPDATMVPQLRSEKSHDQWVSVAVSGLGGSLPLPLESTDGTPETALIENPDGADPHAMIDLDDPVATTPFESVDDFSFF